MIAQVHIELDNSAIRILTDAAVQALEMTGAALYTDLVQAQTIPRDTGDLQNQYTFVDYTKSREGTVSFVHAGPYARRLYYHPEYHFSHVENKNAKGRWLDDYLPGGKKKSFVQSTYAQLYRKLSGVK